MGSYTSLQRRPRRKTLHNNQTGLAPVEQTLNLVAEHVALSSTANTTVNVAVLDADLRYVEVSDGLAKLHGLAPEEHLGKSVREIVPQLAPVLEPLLRKIISTGEPAFNIELTGEMATDPGINHRWLISFIPLYGANGKLQGICALGTEAHQSRAVELERQTIKINETPAPMTPRGDGILSDKVKALKDVATALTTAAEVLEQAEKNGLRSSLDVEHGIDFDEEVKRFETHLIERALKRTHGNQKQAARLLRMKHTTLHTKIKRYGIPLPSVI